MQAMNLKLIFFCEEKFTLSKLSKRNTGYV